jgi:predicted nucleic acid-binding protein
MRLVADANILFALAKDGSTANAITERYRIRLYSPDYVLKELREHQKELTEKIGRPYQKIMKDLENRISFIDEKEYCSHLQEAEKLLPDDTEDAPYLALAIKYRTAVWSNDKHLKTQEKIPVFTTRELLELLTP